MYMFVILSFFAMQCLAEWKKLQIKKTSASNESLSTKSDVFKKTGMQIMFIMKKSYFPQGPFINDVTKK